MDRQFRCIPFVAPLFEIARAADLVLWIVALAAYVKGNALALPVALAALLLMSNLMASAKFVRRRGSEWFGVRNGNLEHGFGAQVREVIPLSEVSVMAEPVEGGTCRLVSEKVTFEVPPWMPGRKEFLALIEAGKADRL